jgi:hypothetical protein
MIQVEICWRLLDEQKIPRGGLGCRFWGAMNAGQTTKKFAKSAQVEACM